MCAAVSIARKPIFDFKYSHSGECPLEQEIQNIKDGENQLDGSCEKSISMIRVKTERNILHTLKRTKISWIDHIFLMNCSLKHVSEGKIEWKGSVVRRRK
jgi:hypothetical protein